MHSIYSGNSLLVGDLILFIGKNRLNPNKSYFRYFGIFNEKNSQS